MPWISDESGNKSYKLSLYSKEELPTWGEIYELFTKNQYFYDPNHPDQQEMDLYWNIPHQKYLVGIVYNQLNKMIFEDGFKFERIFEHQTYFDDPLTEITDMRFLYTNPLSDEPLTSMSMMFTESSVKDIDKLREIFLIDKQSPPPIITIPMPNGEPNPFIVNDYPRVNINDIDALELYPMIKFNTKKYKDVIYIIGNSFNSGGYFTYQKVMIDFLQPYWQYFEDPVGWKDKETKAMDIIGSDILTHCK